MSYQGNTGCSCGGNSGGGGTTVVCSRPSIPVAAPGMCLTDGTPIAVISTRTKDGAWVRTGWLNLATGGFTAGRPPASAAPCDTSTGGEATLAGVHVESWCDVDGDGNLLSPVLAKYQADDTGAIVDVEFLTPGGEPYEVQGTLGVCNPEPGSSSRELVRLCDTTGSGEDTEVVVFLRDYERNADSTIAGYTDYTLDGQPYTPTGVVSSCDTTNADGDGGCDSPTTPVATTGLCLADGTPIAVTMERDCDGVVTRTGWIDLATGTYSDGQYPDGTRACGETSAFDVSGVLCDVDPDTGDVHGLVLIEVERGTDGEITGTRLINAADGTEYELQGTLSVCPAGVDQPKQDMIQLCDLTDEGEDTVVTRFLRDYRRDENGVIAGHSDYTLDGDPYTPVGEVGSCDDLVDETTQAERDLLRLCDVVEDGEGATHTVFVRDYDRDRAGVIVGYTDYTLDGDPYTPVGEVGSCDTVTEASAPRERDLVRLCDVVDAGEESDTVEFLRDYDRDTNGVVVGFTDYTLDGQPYTPVGAVESCIANTDSGCVNCETVTLCDTQPGDQAPTEFMSVPLAQLPPAGRFGDGSPVSGTLDNGVDYTVNIGEWVSPQDHYTFYPSDNPQTWVFSEPVFVRVGLRGLNITPTECYVLPEGVEVESINPNHVWDPAARTLCDSGTSTAQDESYFVTTGPVSELELRASGSSTGGRGPGLIEAALPTDSDTSGERVAFLRTYCRDCDGALVSVTDTELDGDTDYTVVGVVSVCDTNNSGETPASGFTAVPVVMCDHINAGEDSTAVAFLRTYRVDHATGTVAGHTDTTLDGTTPYTPAGEVGQCDIEQGHHADVEGGLLCLVGADGERLREVWVERVYDHDGTLIEQRVTDPTTTELVEIPDSATIGQCVEPCHDITDTMLCDLVEPEESVTAATADTAVPERDGAFAPLPGGGSDLWDGGTLEFPQEPDASAGDGEQIYRQVAGQITATPECGDRGSVTVSVRVRNDGPSAGAGTTGGLRLLLGDELVGVVGVPTGAPVGYDEVLTATANSVTADDLAAGALVAEVWLETFHVNPKSWTVSEYTVDVDFGACETQFMRTRVTDCETGETLSTIDTTLDGEPYEVTGEVGQCQTAGGGECCPPPEPQPSPDLRCREHILCDTGPDGDDPITFMRTICRDSTGAVVSVTDTELDATTPYTVRT